MRGAWAPSVPLPSGSTFPRSACGRSHCALCSGSFTGPWGRPRVPPPRLRRLSPGRTLGVTFSSSPPPSTRAQGRPYPEAAARGSETHTGPLTSRTRANHANTVFRLTALRLQWGHGTASGLGRGSHGGGWAGRAVTEAGATQRSPVGLSYEDTRGSRQAPALGSVTTPPWGVWGPGK